MIHFLDADFLIRAKNEHFQMDRVPEYWDWLVENGEAGDIKIPLPIYEEIMRGDDSLKKWLQKNKAEQLMDDPDALHVVSEILSYYGNSLTEDQIEMIGSDPFLIAYASHHGGAVVTREVSKPSRVGHNRKIPDICLDTGVRLVREPELIRDLDFRTHGARR